MALKYSRARRDCLCFIELAGIRTNDSCEFAFYIAPIRFQWFGSILQGCAVGTAFVSSEHVGIHCDITSSGGGGSGRWLCIGAFVSLRRRVTDLCREASGLPRGPQCTPPCTGTDKLQNGSCVNAYINYNQNGRGGRRRGINLHCTQCEMHAW